MNNQKTIENAAKVAVEKVKNGHCKFSETALLS